MEYWSGLGATLGLLGDRGRPGQRSIFDEMQHFYAFSIKKTVAIGSEARYIYN